ncbi:MAG: motility protein A, partial [Parasporobacterium sp.]|nr:motility protein A [Parasporobacterium sp.]
MACLIFIILSIALGQDGIAGVQYFIDYPSIMITFGGAFACVLSSCTIKEFVNGLKSAGITFKMPSLNA